MNLHHYTMDLELRPSYLYQFPITDGSVAPYGHRHLTMGEFLIIGEKETLEKKIPYKKPFEET